MKAWAESSLDMRRGGYMGASEPNVNEHDGLGQFDNRKSRRRRRITSVVGFVAIVLVTVLVVTHLEKHSPPTPEEYILSLFPTNFVGFKSIQKAEIELRNVTETNSGLIEYAVGYFSARDRYSEELLGLELRVEHYETAALAKRRVDVPCISPDWGFDGCELVWEEGGHSRDLPDSSTIAAVDACIWWMEWYDAPLSGALFYSWTRGAYRFQMMLVGNAAYIMSDEGESHIRFAWEDVRSR